ncbi:MAG: glycosyltransferase family 2 protein [Rhodospirillales bacterium]|nr:glycosyltransferase family 2 protein [Rhodospirillales bacterium]MDH3912194.1 glycosyltransferase family 2 protein [Rhodospirillales bacterium]MDH3917553.1 glycosyltransferase family 2 protein [Rhodospirillales bacterium]MDH3966955.1 glycosyltransferase family 2 protein [Rhodospirillales bacterium]
MAWVRVVVVNYNSGDLLARAVACLAAQSDPDFEAVIVDNASGDGSADRLVLPDDRFTLVRSEANLGFAAGSNLGCRGARTDWLATLNPDAFPEPGWLAALRAAVARYPGAAMFGSLQIDARDPDRLDGCGDNYSFFGINWRGGHGQRFAGPPADGECFSPCGAAALYRREAFEAVGGFDESYFCYCEDVDLGFRLRLRGGRCVQVGDAVVRHVGSAVTGLQSPFTVYHSARNRLWTYVKNMPAALLWLSLPMHLAATAGLLWNARGGPRLRPMLSGLGHGLRGLGPVLAERRRVQRSRGVSAGTIARALSWSVTKLRRREADLRRP